MSITLEPLGVQPTEHAEVPRFWLLSDLEGEIRLEERYAGDLRHLEPGQ